MHPHLVDLPDDCLLIIFVWLTIPEILFIRRVSDFSRWELSYTDSVQTCRRMAYATRLRSLWYPIYLKLSQLVPTPPLLSPNSTCSLEDVPANILEKTASYAYDLHLRFTRPVPLPTSVVSRKTTKSDRKQLSLLPGARWFVAASIDPDSFCILDLEDADTGAMFERCFRPPPDDYVGKSVITALLTPDYIHVFRVTLTCPRDAPYANFIR